MTEQLEFAPDKIMEVLVRHGVAFIVIGGLAALAHGSILATEDVDITPEPSVGNIDRLLSALTELDGRVHVGDDFVPVGESSTSLADAGGWNVRTILGELDIVMVPCGTRGYADLVREATDERVVEVVVPVASLADVIRSKQAANRPKDQRVLPVLREILASRYDKR